MGFTPTFARVPLGQTVTTTFKVTATDQLGATTDASASVVATAAREVALVVSGIAAAAVTAVEVAPLVPGSQAASGPGTVRPFSFLVSKPDFRATVSATITHSDAGGTVTDARGTLSGRGLVCTRTSRNALDALVFTPTPGISGLTTLSLAVTDGTQTTAATAGGPSVPAARRSRCSSPAPTRSARNST